MRKVVNISRREAVKWGGSLISSFLGEKIAWISISEPGEQNTIVSNPILDSYSNLKIAPQSALYPPCHKDQRNF